MYKEKNKRKKIVRVSRTTHPSLHVVRWLMAKMKKKIIVLLLVKGTDSLLRSNSSFGTHIFIYAPWLYDGLRFSYLFRVFQLFFLLLSVNLVFTISIFSFLFISLPSSVPNSIKNISSNKMVFFSHEFW